MRRRWSRPAALVTAVAVAGALALGVSACGDDDGGFSTPDAHLPDVPGDASDTDGPTSEGGVLVPPGGGSPLGWRVMNRFGEVAITDPGGAFTLPVDPDGVTVTVGVPPAARPGDTNLLLAVSARLPEYAAEPPPLRLDARTTAIALLATHPLLLDDEPWRAGRLLERLVDHRATAALVDEVEARWAHAPTPLADAAFMAAWATAAAIVARELAPPWEDAIADGAVGHGGETRVRPLDASLPVLAAPAAGGAVRFTTPRARALAARVVLAPIAADGDHRRTRADGAGAPLRWRDRIDVLATRDGDASRVDFDTGPEQLHRTVIPEGPAWAAAAAAALTAAARAEGATAAIPDHSAWLATAVTGAVGGAEAEAAWLAAPAASWSAARLNVAAEVGRLVRWAAPAAAPCTALGADDDPTGAAAAAAVAAANGSARLLASLTAGLAAARSACAVPEDPAAPWLFPVVERGLATLAPDDLRLVRSPDSPLPALVDGRAGFATGRLLIHRGEPLAPRVDALGGRPVGAAGLAPLEVAVGEAVSIAGARLDAEGARVELTDASGRTRGAALRPADGGGLELVVPSGLGGLTRVEAVGAGGRSPVFAELLIAPRLDRLMPPLVYRGGAPVALRIEGDGFAPGGALHLGEHAIPFPDDALPEGFVVLVDPADLAAGPLDVAVAAPGGGAPRATGVTLEVAPAPVITSVAPTSLARGAALELLARHVGDEVDAISVSVDDGVAIHPLPVRFATATDGAERRISTGPSPSPVAGLVTVTLTTPAGSDSVVIDVPAPPPRLERAYSYGADHPLVRAAHLDKGLRVANGALVPGGEFWRLDTGLTYAGVPYCPLEIRPASFAFGNVPCNHPTGICPDNWIWDDSRDPATWIKMSRPPGRRGSGACPAQPGIASWSALAGPGQVFDTITSAGAVSLAGAIPLSGPGARLALPEARGGGLVITAAEGGEPNDVVLDLVVREATGNVVTLQAVDGVHIERLVIEGVPGACQVGLIVNNSRNVRIDHLEVSGCGTGLWIGSSSDVRLTQPATLFANTLGARILYSADLDLRVRVGIRPAPNEAGFALAAGQVDGVLVEGGQRVTLHAPAIVGLAGDAVRVTQSADVRVGATIGHAWRPDGGLVASAATRVGAGVRIGPDATRIRVEDAAVLGA